jgi:putative oxygen-independent coproporphyrinogen III oxidase
MDATRWLDAPVESGAAAGFGLYVHIPFCSHRCGYCDFATYVPDRIGGAAMVDRYVAALYTEITRTLAVGPAPLAPPGSGPAGWPTVTSIFVGGGTPTLLPADVLVGLIDRVRTELDVLADAEITVEANPETVGPEAFGALAAGGVNRISMGAQSFAGHVLATLERGHTPERPLAAVAEARAAGIVQVNLDLIYGTPGETEADWERTLATALTAGGDHVSAYALTIHDNTAFGRAVATGALPDVDEDVQRHRFDVARDVLRAGGFQHYEVSNWSLGSGARSRHNLLYWRHGDYLAFGVGAHGHLAGRRWWNTRSVPGYVAAIEDGGSPVAGDEILTVGERAEERLLLGLRVREGLHPNDVPPIEPLALEDAMAQGLVETACGRLRATDDGWFLLDETVRRLT